jgi:ABC-type multidrug transport system fused ATPase/permease subunit
VRRANRGDDGKAQPGSGGPARVEAGEALEDALPELRVDAGTMVGHQEFHVASRDHGADLYHGAGRGVRDGVPGPVKSLSRLSATVARGTASRDRIAELLCLPVLEACFLTAQAASITPAHRTARTSRPERGPAITLDRVSYAHRPGRLVLAEATLHVPAGTLLA